MAWSKNYMKEECIRERQIHTGMMPMPAIKHYVGPGVVVTSGSAQYDVQGNIISDTRKFATNTTAVNYIDWIFATYVNGVPGANMYKRSFVKLREVVLSYNFEPKSLKKTPFSSASISVNRKKSIVIHRCSVYGSGRVFQY